MSKCDFNKVPKQFIGNTLRDGCSPVNLVHIFRTSLPKNTPGRQLLYITCSKLHVHSVLLPDNLMEYLISCFHNEVFKVGFSMKKAENF